MNEELNTIKRLRDEMEEERRIYQEKRR